VRRAPRVRELAAGLLRRLAAGSTRLADRLSPPGAASDAPPEWLAMVAARQPSLLPLLRGRSVVPARFDHYLPEGVPSISAARPASAPWPRAVARPVAWPVAWPVVRPVVAPLPEVAPRPVVTPLPDAVARPVVTPLPDAVARPRVAPSHARSALSPFRSALSPDRVTLSPSRATPIRPAEPQPGRVVSHPAPFLPLLRGSSGHNEPGNHSFPEGAAREGRWPTLLGDDPLWTSTASTGRTDVLDAEQRGAPWTA
jgi:hypothetical protein